MGDGRPWEVHHRGRIDVWSEAEIRRRLNSGDLSGVELVRRSPDEAWRPLQATPLVPARHRPRRSLRLSGFIAHLVAFVSVTGPLWRDGGLPPAWVFVWAVGLAAHGIRAFRTCHPARPSPPADPVPVSELEAAIGRLVAAGWTGDADALSSVAAELSRRRALLEAATDPASTEALRRELEDVTAALATADPGTAEVLTTTRDAIAARLAFLEDTAALAARTRARERALLHQVESLRLGLLHRGEREGPDLGDAVRRLRAELDAEAEVTEALARARSAATAPGRPSDTG